MAEAAITPAQVAINVPRLIESCLPASDFGARAPELCSLTVAPPADGSLAGCDGEAGNGSGTAEVMGRLGLSAIDESGVELRTILAGLVCCADGLTAGGVTAGCIGREGIPLCCAGCARLRFFHFDMMTPSSLRACWTD